MVPPLKCNPDIPTAAMLELYGASKDDQLPMIEMLRLAVFRLADQARSKGP